MCDSRLASSRAFALNFTYSELADMAARLYALNKQDYSLEDVTAFRRARRESRQRGNARQPRHGYLS